MVLKWPKRPIFSFITIKCIEIKHLIAKFLVDAPIFGQLIVSALPRGWRRNIGFSPRVLNTVLSSCTDVEHECRSRLFTATTLPVISIYSEALLRSWWRNIGFSPRMLRASTNVEHESPPQHFQSFKVIMKHWEADEGILDFRHKYWGQFYAQVRMWSMSADYACSPLQHFHIYFNL